MHRQSGGLKKGRFVNNSSNLSLYPSTSKFCVPPKGPTRVTFSFSVCGVKRNPPLNSQEIAAGQLFIFRLIGTKSTMQLKEACTDFLSGYFSTNERSAKTKASYYSDLAQFQQFTGPATK